MNDRRNDPSVEGAYTLANRRSHPAVADHVEVVDAVGASSHAGHDRVDLTCGVRSGQGDRDAVIVTFFFDRPRDRVQPGWPSSAGRFFVPHHDGTQLIYVSGRAERYPVNVGCHFGWSEAEA